MRKKVQLCLEAEKERNTMPFDMKAYKKKYAKAYYQKNKEKIKAQVRSYEDANKEKKAEQRKSWYERNKEKVAARGKEYYENNKEKCLALSKAYAKNNKEKLDRYKNKYYENNKEKVLATKKAWADRNKEQISIKAKEYRSKNKEKVREINRAYNQANKDKRNALHAKRRALKFRATIRLTELDKFVIDEMYSLAKLRTEQTGIRWHVDHIVPLTKGGLHKPTNLQVVPGSWNESKGNRNCEVYNRIVQNGY